jgi:lysophospholipase L1-like esterase
MSFIDSSELLLFQGDSITDSGRNDSPGGLGSGYVAIIAGLLYGREKGPRPRILNRGIGGDRSVELLARWKSDCEDLGPDTLSLMIGVNDVWRIRGEWNGQAYVPLSAYTANYRQLIDRSLGCGVKRLILMSPTTIFDEGDAEVSKLLDEEAETTSSLAKEYKALYVPTREEQRRLLKERKEIAWTQDGCHPSLSGHATIAACWLKAAGLC